MICKQTKTFCTDLGISVDLWIWFSSHRLQSNRCSCHVWRIWFEGQGVSQAQTKMGPPVFFKRFPFLKQSGWKKTAEQRCISITCGCSHRQQVASGYSKTVSVCFPSSYTDEFVWFVWFIDAHVKAASLVNDPLQHTERCQCAFP